MSTVAQSKKKLNVDCRTQMAICLRSHRRPTVSRKSVNAAESADAG